jgi:predicted ATPase
MRAPAPRAVAAVVDRGLMSLVRRDLIRPERAAFGDDEAFRFRHILIRDAAYRSLPKETRAELHERFAGWMEEAQADRVHEFEEIVGYHLEQASRYLTELGREGARSDALAARAAGRLESAGHRAHRRGDRDAAISLLERAARLAGDDSPRRAALLPDLGGVLIEAGRLSEADAVLAEATRVAATAGDECAAARAAVQQRFLALQRDDLAGRADTAELVDRVLPVLQAGGDEEGVCSALGLRAWHHWIGARAGEASAAWEEAELHARNAGLEHQRVEILGWIASALFFGPVPVSAGIERCEEMRKELGGNLLAVSFVLQPLAGLHAMEGRFAEARELLDLTRSALAELGLSLHSAVSHHAATVELLAGQPEAAERWLREGYELLEEMGDRNFLSTTAAFLGETLLAQDRDEEAERFAGVSARLAAGDDLLTQGMWRCVQAAVLAGRGEVDEAERLAREAVAIGERTDFLNYRADMLVRLAEVLARRGQAEEAEAARAEGLRLYERKGNLVASGRLRGDLVRQARV